MIPRAGRLFWKLVLALWVSMLLSIALTTACLHLMGYIPPPRGDDLLSVGPLPLLPLITGAVTVLVTGLVLAWYLSRPLNHLRWALHRVAEGTRLGINSTPTVFINGRRVAGAQPYEVFAGIIDEELSRK